ncbi:acyltransferase family protein [Litorisediminicola beolgyonensis]|uniref:Acyltransferase family protein n=1 Tax=Litorisediminicola beolgyonensis TaxID=1173614 RepID=A0ABW3ZJX3_9RHOB
MTPATLIESPRVPPQTRDASLDALRGGALCLVVLGHALIGAGHGTAWQPAAVAMIYAVHMPVLFALSGSLAAPLSTRAWPEVASRVLTRMVWPYLLWSTILILAHVAASGATNGHAELSRIATLLTDPHPIMWYLYALACGTLILRLAAAFGAAQTLALAAVIWVAAYAFEGVPSLARYVALFLLFAVSGPQLMRWSERPAVIGGAVAVIAATALWIATAPPILTGDPTADPGFAAAALAAPLAGLALSRMAAPVVFVQIGRAGMAVFTTHVLFTAGARIALLRAGVDYTLVLVVAATLAGLAGPLMLDRALVGTRPATGLGWR